MSEKDPEKLSFADQLRETAKAAREKSERAKIEAINLEIEPVLAACRLAAAEGKNETMIRQGKLSKDGVDALRRLGLRVSNFETRYASITVAWNK